MQSCTRSHWCAAGTTAQGVLRNPYTSIQQASVSAQPADVCDARNCHTVLSKHIYATSPGWRAAGTTVQTSLLSHCASPTISCKSQHWRAAHSTVQGPLLAFRAHPHIHASRQCVHAAGIIVWVAERGVIAADLWRA